MHLSVIHTPELISTTEGVRKQMFLCDARVNAH